MLLCHHCLAPATARLTYDAQAAQWRAQQEAMQSSPVLPILRIWEDDGVWEDFILWDE